nr:MAG TPA: hypothetical protein [Caudoviricetes sp.]
MNKNNQFSLFLIPKDLDLSFVSTSLKSYPLCGLLIFFSQFSYS